jgi:hypothetical protein
VLLGLYGIWHGAPDWPGRTLDLGFLISNDGIHFREPVTEFVFLRRGEDGEWDQGGLIQGQGFENIGDKTYVWYGAWDPRFIDPYVPRGGLGLAQLEKDRFGSLSPRESRGASLVTSELRVTGKAKLFVNASGLSDESRLIIELLDTKERPLPGYSGVDAATVSEEGFRVPVSWRIHGIRDSFRIRVRFDGSSHSKLYALYLTSE